MIIPTVSENYPDDVFSLHQLPGNIVSDIESPAVKTCVHRIEPVIAGLFPVDAQLIQPGRGYIGPGSFDLPVCAELLPEIWRRLEVEIVCVGYPVSCPGGLVHKSGLE